MPPVELKTQMSTYHTAKLPTQPQNKRKPPGIAFLVTRTGTSLQSQNKREKKNGNADTRFAFSIKGRREGRRRDTPAANAAVSPDR